MSSQFDGKVALVAGGSTGIGEATAARFAREGASVVIASRGVEHGMKAVEAIRTFGGEATYVRADVSKADEVESLVNKAVEAYGRIDFAFNNAGIGIGELLHECEEEDWDRVMNTNLKGIWLCMKYEITQMLKQGVGVIVNTSSAAGLTGFVRSPSYAASKHGVIGLTKSAALQYATKGIRINTVCPGLIMTPMAEQVFAAAEGAQEWFESKQPTGQAGAPEQIAQAVTWLCSDSSSFVTGEALRVDGGLLSGLW